MIFGIIKPRILNGKWVTDYWSWVTSKWIEIFGFLSKKYEHVKNIEPLTNKDIVT